MVYSALLRRLLAAGIIVGIVAAQGAAYEPAVDNAVESLMLPDWKLTSLSARDPDGNHFDYRARIVDGVLYFEPEHPNWWNPDVLQVQSMPDSDAGVYLEFLRTRHGQIIASQPAKGHQPGLRRYWAVDWQADQPTIVLAEDPQQAAVWTYETVDIASKPLLNRTQFKPIGTYFITRHANGQPYYLGVSRLMQHRVGATWGAIHELHRPILNSDALWGFHLSIVSRKTGEKMPTELTSETELAAPEDPSRRCAGDWTPNDLVLATARGHLSLGSDRSERELMLLEGRPVWWDRFHGAGVWNSDAYRKERDPAVRAAWRLHFERPDIRLYPSPKPHQFRIGWESMTGAGYRFLAVDWTASPPLVTITRQPNQAAIWTLPGPGVEDGPLARAQSNGPVLTADERNQIWYLASQADPITVPTPGGGARRCFLPVLSKQAQPAVTYQAEVPPPPIDGK